MLVITRRPDESLQIDRDIVVTVLEIRGDKVRLGIQADRHRAVHRQEVWAAIQHMRSPSPSPVLEASGAEAAPAVSPDASVFG